MARFARDRPDSVHAYMEDLIPLMLGGGDDDDMMMMGHIVIR